LTNPRAHWGWYVLLAILAAHVLLHASGRQIYDTNFYVLWEYVALMAGDHPYRDFFQFGSPLLTGLTTAVQWAVGTRLIGEFLIHWIFLIAAVLIGFHLAVRLSGSVAASVVTSLLVIAALAATPTFNFPKLFFYPAAVLLGWWYMDRPGIRRAAALGLITAMAFLFRHDHGVYIGTASVLAFALTRLIAPPLRGWRGSLREIAAYVIVAGVVIAPWAAVVEANEGFVDYVRMRAEWNQTWAPNESPFLILRDFSPVPVLAGSEPDENEPLAEWFPERDPAAHWLAQISILVPLLVLLAAVIDMIRRKRRGLPIGIENCRLVLAASIALIVADRLFRQDSYFLSAMPLTAALGARLLAPRRQAGDDGSAPRISLRVWRVARALTGAAVVGLTAIAVVGFVEELRLLKPFTLDDLPIARLMASPPIDGYQPAWYAVQLEPEGWREMDGDRKQQIMMRYMHDCTTDGDRILVTGSTPYQVGYYVNRPIAGAHLQWHHGWRSDPEHEMQSLRLVQSQSVPFAFSTHDPIMEDFKAYPRIHEYLATHYRELEASDGLLLVDSRRTPTGEFGQVGFPCFAER
jgi:hypothetical protein